MDAHEAQPVVPALRLFAAGAAGDGRRDEGCGGGEVPDLAAEGPAAGVWQCDVVRREIAGGIDAAAAALGLAGDGTGCRSARPGAVSTPATRRRAFRRRGRRGLAGPPPSGNSASRRSLLKSSTGRWLRRRVSSPNGDMAIWPGSSRRMARTSRSTLHERPPGKSAPAPSIRIFFTVTTAANGQPPRFGVAALHGPAGIAHIGERRGKAAAQPGGGRFPGGDVGRHEEQGERHRDGQDTESQFPCQINPARAVFSTVLQRSVHKRPACPGMRRCRPSRTARLLAPSFGMAERETLPINGLQEFSRRLLQPQGCGSPQRGRPKKRCRKRA